jgi:hypothetical protein
VRRIIGEHLAGRRDQGGLIWRLVVLNGWLQALRDGKLAGPQRVHELLRRTVTAQSTSGA